MRCLCLCCSLGAKCSFSSWDSKSWSRPCLVKRPGQPELQGEHAQKRATCVLLRPPCPVNRTGQPERQGDHAKKRVTGGLLLTLRIDVCGKGYLLRPCASIVCCIYRFYGSPAFALSRFSNFNIKHAQAQRRTFMFRFRCLHRNAWKSFLCWSLLLWR